MTNQTSPTNSWKKNIEDVEGAALEPLKKGLQQIIDSLNKGKCRINLKPDRLICEVLYICSRIEREHLCADDIHTLLEDIKTHLGWYHAANIVMMAVCGMMSRRKDLPFETQCLMKKLELKYKLRPEMDTIKAFVYNMRWNPLKDLLFTDHLLELSQITGKIPIVYIGKVDQFNAILGNNATIER